MHRYLYIIILVHHILDMKYNSGNYCSWTVLSFKHISELQTAENMTLLNKTEGIEVWSLILKIRKEWLVLIHTGSGTGGPQMNTVSSLCC